MRVCSQFATFAVVGLLCAAIDVGVMQLLISMSFHHLSAASCGFILGLSVNFFLHSLMTFRVDISWKAFWRFISVVAINYSTTLVLVSIAFSSFGYPLIGKLVSLPLVAIIGYILSRTWVFR